ncbi:MAG: hypothetical protein IE926_20540, partial [Micrococcales bacterium]|nr:hypothetical protein [Micrococcales bacterium]
MTGSTGATTDGRAAPTGGRAVRAVPALLRPLTTTLRWGPLVALAAGWALWCARAAATPSGVSWHWFAEGSRQLLAEGTSVYAQHPDLQVGPLTLLVVAGARAVAGAHALGLLQVLSTVCLAVVGWALLRLLGAAPSAPRVAGALAGWLVLAPAWAVLAVRWVHPDDVLALTLLAVLVAAVARPGRWSAEVAALAVVLAVAAKPWAVVGVPLLLALPRARWRAVGLAVVGVAAVWLPFLLAARGTTGALAPPVRVSDTSVLWWLGLHDGGVVPAWVRPVQLVGAPALALLAVLRGRWLRVRA